MKNFIKVMLVAGVLLFANSFVSKGEYDVDRIVDFLDTFKTRIEIWYDHAKKELQIHVQGRERIQHAKIFFGNSLIAEFKPEQIPSNDTLRVNMPCPGSVKVSYVITTIDGSQHYIKYNRKTDLFKQGTFWEMGEPKSRR